MFNNHNIESTSNNEFEIEPMHEQCIVDNECIPEPDAESTPIDPVPVVAQVAPAIVRYSTTPFENELNYSEIAKYLENEKIKNKQDSWNKLDKTDKIQKLHAFAEKYGKDNGIPIKEIKNLKMFFKDCLEKNKLQKTKDVVYDKEHHTITSIPSLLFNVSTRGFTLKIMDSKRVSTIKSLTPKRSSEKNKLEIA